MGESMLSSLAIVHIKYDMPIDLNEVVNLFDGLHPRIMQLHHPRVESPLLWVDK